ncbi:MAG: putative system TPR-repeat lipoprotein [Bryobacterales bacterium]|nr:putative system TPR-repeat lipoprotein [Bryobacterales bacterium]
MRLILIVAAVMVVMYGIDKFLAGQERNEVRQDAHLAFAAGERLLREGKPNEAVLNFGRAHALQRSNPDYEIALASAQLAEGRIDTARNTLDNVLQDDSNNARANLLMARVMVAKQAFSAADSYYHRAIYGAWPANSQRERADIRLELADLLAKRGANEELLSELLLLQNEPATDPDREARVAALLLQAGTASRAADAYRALIHRDPENPAAFAGLAQAETLRGNYRAARSAYRSALRIDPGDAPLRGQQEMVERLANLDPTPRHLSSAEKYSRSLEILTLVNDELRACMHDIAPVATPPKPKGAVTNELAESVLQNAERLWKARSDSCKQPPEPFDPLPVLMKKLSQQ